MSRTSIRVNPQSIVCLNVKELLARSSRHIRCLSESNQMRTHNHLVGKRTLNHLGKLAKWLGWVVSTYLYVAFYSMVIIMSRTSFRVNTESIVCLNVTELLAWSRRHIWTLRYSNDIQTHNHLVCKRTVNRLTQLAKWLSCVVSTYMYGAFGCMLLSRDVRKLEWIHTLWFSWMSKNFLFEAIAISEI